MSVAAEGLVLEGNLHMGGNCVRRAELAWMVLQVVHWGRTYRVKDLPWLVQSQLFDGFRISFF